MTAATRAGSRPLRAASCADRLLVLQRVPEPRVPARHLLVHLVPGDAGRREDARARRAARPARRRRRRGRARRPRAATAPGPRAAGGQWSRIGASQGRPAYSANRSATQARRASSPRVVDEHPVGARGLLVLGELAGAARVEVLAARLDPRGGARSSGAVTSSAASNRPSAPASKSSGTSQTSSGGGGRRAACSATHAPRRRSIRGCSSPSRKASPPSCGERARAERGPVDRRRRARGPRRRSARPPRATTSGSRVEVVDDLVARQRRRAARGERGERLGLAGADPAGDGDARGRRSRPRRPPRARSRRPRRARPRRPAASSAGSASASAAASSAPAPRPRAHSASASASSATGSAASASSATGLGHRLLGRLGLLGASASSATSASSPPGSSAAAGSSASDRLLGRRAPRPPALGAGLLGDRLVHRGLLGGRLVDGLASTGSSTTAQPRSLDGVAASSAALEVRLLRRRAGGRAADVVGQAVLDRVAVGHALQAQRQAAPVGVDLDDPDGEHVALVDHLARVLHVVGGQLGDVHEALDARGGSRRRRRT